jgi:hypothetical protein
MLDSPSTTEVRRSLAVLFQVGDTIELRCVGNGNPLNGFYRSHDKAAQDAVSLNATGQNVFFCLNPALPELFARRRDQFGPCRNGEAVKDHEIACRRWLLIDIDAARPDTKLSATDSQKQFAKVKAQQIAQHVVHELRLPAPLVADSGNGYHLLLRLADWRNDAETRWICKTFLEQLHTRFSDATAHVDTSVFNAARICTSWGTRKMKGFPSPEQPHRLSKLEHVPQLCPITIEQLTAITGPYPGEPLQPQPSSSGRHWNVQQLLNERQVQYAVKSGQAADGSSWTTYELHPCPFNPEHTNGSAVLMQFATGAVAFKCHHNSCADKNWSMLKAMWGLPESSGPRAEDIKMPISQQAVSPQLLIVRSRDVQTERIEWLWHHRLVIGGINLMCGRGGIGKSYFLADLVARISNGSLTAPNGDDIVHGRVLYASGEDHIAKVIEPRAQSHGVDRSRLEYIKGFPSGQYLQLLDVVAHLNLLRDAVRQRPDTVALVLDPISCFQGSLGDCNKVNQVRQFTAALTQLAEEFNLAILGVHHFNKGRKDVAGDAISGSHAYRDAARTTWLFALDEKDPARRLMVCDKNNWAETRPSGLAYRIVSGRIYYEPTPLEMTADELMKQGTENALDIACSWLLAQLSSGPRSALELQVAATADRIADRTLTRAKERLQVHSYKESGSWFWRLPGKDAKVS